MKLVASAGIQYLIFGHKEHFQLHVTVENNGDPAYVTELTITYPADIYYIGMNRDDGLDQVTCRPRNGVIQNGAVGSRQASLLCEVGNPVPANSTMQFKIILDSHDVTSVDTVEFTTNSSTLSDDLNLDNNNITVVVPIQYDYNCDVQG